MKLIIIGATPFQREMWKTLNKDRVIEVEFVDSIRRMIPVSIDEQINMLRGRRADYYICDDVIGDHKLNKDLVDFNQGKRLSSLDDIKLTDENGFYPFERLFDSMQIDHGLGRVNSTVFKPNKSNQVMKKQITYGPKQSYGKGKTKRWRK